MLVSSLLFFGLQWPDKFVVCPEIVGISSIEP